MNTTPGTVLKDVTEPGEGEQHPKLIAYRLSPTPPLRLVPAPRERDWMDATGERFAYRCLPLNIANQSGWWLLNSHALTVEWSGGSSIDAVHLEWRSGTEPYPALSHFGSGILTWHIPFLFRTPPGWNLLARGPANYPKAGITPLEGVVETDWAVATFTMNWKMTAINQPVTFDAGEPICQIVPHRRGDLEGFEPEVREITADPDLEASFQEWSASRARFLGELREPGSDAVRRKWQKDYFHGATPDGRRAAQHQTKLRLNAFDDPAGVCFDDGQTADGAREGRPRG